MNHSIFILKLRTKKKGKRKKKKKYDELTIYKIINEN